jgi:hypothetical protein
MRQMITGLTMCAALGVLAPTGDAKAPQTSTTPATVVFRDAGVLGEPGSDRIRSDGGAYVHGGQRGLEVQLWTCADCSQDLTIGTFRSGRTLYFDYGDKAAGSGAGPTGVMYDNAFVNVRAIAAMGVGEIRTTKASFNTSVGYFRWLGSPYPEGGSVNGGPFGSQAVVVQRTSQTTWEVYTPVPPDETVAPGYTASDLNVLLQSGRKGTLTPVGNYHMPFGLTITCPTCP